MDAGRPDLTVGAPGVVKTLCRMCDDRCGIDVHVRGGRVVDVTGNKDHLASRGNVCVKARAAVDLVYHPDRLLTPLKRTATGWREIALAEALDEIAERLAGVRDNYGARSLGVWKGEALGFAQQEDMARRFTHAVGSPNYLCVDAVCWAARQIAYTAVDGGWPLPDFKRARCVVLWAAAPTISHPNMLQDIRAARRGGASLVVVDPRRSAVARDAEIHAAVRPGTDGALVWGLIHEIIEADAFDHDFVRRNTVGFAEIAGYAKRSTPQVVQDETGVPAATVRAMARLLAASAPRVASYAGLGLEHHSNGVNTVRAVAVLDALLGALGAEGGVRLRPAPPLRDLTLYEEVPLRRLEPFGADRFPALYDICHDCHTPTAVTAMLTGEPYPLRGLIVTGANPVLAHPDAARVRRALESLDLLVVRDLFMTDTAALADYVLPAASFLERTELHAHPRHQVLTLTAKALSLPGVQGEYDFWRALALRLGVGDAFPWKDETALDRWLLEPTGLTLEQLESHPEGVPYDAGEPVPPTLPTPSGKVELISGYLKELGHDEAPVYRSPAYVDSPDPAYPLVLMAGGRKLRYLNSQYRTIPRFLEAAPAPELEMHPHDAASLGVGTGDLVRVTSRTGSIEIAVRVVAAGDIVAGSLWAMHGWSEANVNLLTSADDPDPISGFPPLRAVQVHVERLAVAGDQRPQRAARSRPS